MGIMGISGDEIVEQLRQLPNGNAVALCVSFIADTIYPDEDEVRFLIDKHMREANDGGR